MLHLEGLWTRYEDPTWCSTRSPGCATTRSPVVSPHLRRAREPELVRSRIAELHESGHTTCAAVTPGLAPSLLPDLLAAELDLLVIQGTVVSAEHVSKDDASRSI